MKCWWGLEVQKSTEEFKIVSLAGMLSIEDIYSMNNRMIACLHIIIIIYTIVQAKMIIMIHNYFNYGPYFMNAVPL